MSGSRPENNAYEKVAHGDPDLDSEEGSITPANSRAWDCDRPRQRPHTLFSIFWLCIRILFITAAVFAWAASMWLTYIASNKLGQVRALIPDLHRSINRISAIGKSSKSGSQRLQEHQIPNPHHDSLNTLFIPGGTLPVPGYGLVYNTTYCNGWQDPEGAEARGCVLDPTQGGWIHELCHDPELRAEWMKLPDFGWFLDSKRTQQISQDDVWAADIPGGVNTVLYTTMDFHVQHCKFVMRLRIKNGMRRNTGLGYLPLDPGHMYHCVHLMTEEYTAESKELTQVILGKFGGGTEGFGLGGECYMPIL